MSDAASRLNAALEGRYRIERELGEGGMATVYLADDLRHNRPVAIKVLKPELAAVVGSERFLAEIETTANLQHPHILPLFDSGEADGFLFYVMPFVDGETLRDRLGREHQLPVDDAVRIATDVAEALDYAHRKGVIHRDIKPANILLLEGKPVIADFGIALAVGAAGGGRLTETGLSLGTPHYMSPEQATGDQSVGPSSDIYALGCVLYEALAGRPPFSGGTAQAVLGQIITKVPEPVTEHRRSVPANVAAAVAKAVEKIPADRFRHAADLNAALSDPGFRHGTAGLEARPQGGGWSRATTVFATSTAVLALSLVVVLLARPGASPDGQLPPPEVEARLYMSERVTPDTWTGMALSPTGDRLAFVGRDTAGASSIWLRRMDREETEPIAGTDNGRWPSWSPDGRSILFVSNGMLRRVNLETGTILPLCDADALSRGRATWSKDDVILFATGEGLHRVAAAGGACRPVPQESRQAVREYPNLLPDGRRYLFADGVDIERTGVFVGDLESEVVREVIANGESILFLPPHWLLYVESPQGGRDARGLLSVLAQRLDMDTVEPVGEAVPVFGAVSTPGGHASYTAAANGVLTGVRVMDPSPMVWVDRSRRVADSVEVPEGSWTWALSNDGRRLALGGWGLWMHDYDRRVSDRIFMEAGEERITFQPKWSPGDTLLVFAGLLDGPPEAYLYDTRDGSARVLHGEEVGSTGPFAWSPDGRELVFVVRSGPNAGDYLAYDFTSGQRRVLFSLQAAQGPETGTLQFSPDGKWLLYQSDDAGASEIYVRSYPAMGAPRRVSSGGGRLGHWSADGRTIVYESPGGAVMSVAVRLDEGLTLGTPEVALDADEFGGLFGVSSDGQRFLRFHLSQEALMPQLRVVTGWLEGLAETSGGG